MAADVVRDTVWFFTHQALAAYELAGTLRFTLSVTAPGSSYALLTFDRRDGTVWLAEDKDLWSFSATEGGRVWVAGKKVLRIHILAAIWPRNSEWVPPFATACAFRQAEQRAGIVA